MHWILHIVEDTNLFSILLLLLVLSWVGGAIIAERAELAAIARRVSYCVFIGYLGFRCYTHRPGGAEMLLTIVLRGLITAGYTISICWILLPLFSALRVWLARQLVIQPLIASVRPSPITASDSVVATVVSEPAPAFRPAPSPEDVAQIEEERRRVEEENSRRLAERKRREESLLRVELLYERRARELSSIFPRERFDAFVKKYMNDEMSVEWIEEREKLLQDTIADAVGAMTDIKFDSLQALADYFEQRRAEIKAMSIADDVRDSYIVQLNKQEDAALRKFLRT